VFQPIADRDGTVFAHQAYFRAAGPQGAAAPRTVLDGLPDDEAVVRFDRMCRTVHALNRFAGSEEWTPLFLGIDHRLVRSVPDEHGTTFQRILAGFGVLATRVVLALPAEAARVPGLLENALPGYRLRNFRIALDLAGTDLLPRVARLRPDFVRVRADEELHAWAAAAHDAGARLVVTHVEDAEDQDAALRAGADLLQGFHIGRAVEGVATPEVAS
jgi:EAL domain-containing protein (putative c-di-GMP-specific phosphodiesterase class I)